MVSAVYRDLVVVKQHNKQNLSSKSNVNITQKKPNFTQVFVIQYNMYKLIWGSAVAQW